MTAHRTVSLSCQGQDACRNTYPEYDPAENVSVKDLRVEAESKGWEVMHGHSGRDVCPTCRIDEINAAMAGRSPVIQDEALPE